MYLPAVLELSNDINVFFSVIYLISYKIWLTVSPFDVMVWTIRSDAARVKLFIYFDRKHIQTSNFPEMALWPLFDGTLNRGIVGKGKRLYYAEAIHVGFTQNSLFLTCSGYADARCYGNSFWSNGLELTSFFNRMLARNVETTIKCKFHSNTTYTVDVMRSVHELPGHPSYI